MQITPLWQGMRLKFNGRRYILNAITTDGDYLVKDELLGDSLVITRKNFEAAYMENRLAILGDAVALEAAAKRDKMEAVQDLAKIYDDPNRSAALVEDTKRKYIYVRAILDRGAATYSRRKLELLIEEIATELKDPNPPYWYTVYRWLKAFQCRNNCVDLAKADINKGNRKRRLTPEVIKLMEVNVKATYLKDKTANGRSSYNNLCTRIRDANRFNGGDEKHKTPSYSTFMKFINSMDKYQTMVSRFGKYAAERHFAQNGESPEPTRPLEVVQIDHTRADLMVVDAETGMPMGRPWLTIAMDIYTRAIVGIHIGFDHPGYHAVAKCLKNAIGYKSKFLEDYPKVKNEWEQYGVCENLITDNGKEFKSKSFEDACFQLQIVVNYMPPRMPHYKGAIESYFRSINVGLLHNLPGTTFSNIFQRGDYDPAKNALITYEYFKELLLIWILDIYMQREHSQTEKIPALAWKEAIDKCSPRIPAELRSLDILLGTLGKATPSSKGMRLLNLQYNAPCMAEIREQTPKGQKAEFKFDQENLGVIYVLNKVKQIYETVPCTTPDYAEGMSLWQHRLVRKFALANKIRADKEGLLDAQEKIQKIIDENRTFLKQLRNRRKAAQLKRKANTGPSPEKEGLSIDDLYESTNSATDDLSKAKPHKPRKSKTSAKNGRSASPAAVPNEPGETKSVTVSAGRAKDDGEIKELAASYDLPIRKGR